MSGKGRGFVFVIKDSKVDSGRMWRREVVERPSVESQVFEE